MPINKITDSNADATHGVDSIGKIARIMADRNGYGGKHRGGLKPLPLYDKGGDVAVEAGRKAQSEGDARIQSLIDAPTSAPLIESQAPTQPAKQSSGAAKLGSTIQQLRNNKYETSIKDAKAPTYMPGSGPASDSVAAPSLSSIKLPTIMPAYDDGGDVDVNDGKHQVAVLQEGEKVLDPEEAERYRQAQGQKELIPTQQKAQAPSPSIADSTETQVQERGTPEERKAIETDKKQAMGQGVNGFVGLGTALIHENALSAPKELNQGNPQNAAPALPRIGETTAPQETTGLPKIAVPQESHQDTAGGPLISGAPSTETRGEQRDFAAMKLKAQYQDLESQRQKALALRTPEGQEQALRIQLQQEELKKANPWGSEANHPGVLGKIGHVAEMVGSRLPIIGQAMRSIPGTEANRALEHQATVGQIEKITPEVTARAAQENAVDKDTPEQKTIRALLEKGYALGKDEQGNTVLNEIPGYRNSSKDMQGLLAATVQEEVAAGRDPMQSPSVKRIMSVMQGVQKPEKPEHEDDKEKYALQYLKDKNLPDTATNRDKAYKAFATANQAPEHPTLMLVPDGKGGYKAIGVQAGATVSGEAVKPGEPAQASRKAIVDHDKSYVQPANAVEKSYDMMDHAFQEYEDARAKGKDLPTGAQSMVALSTHLSTTFGNVKGARITKDMIQEHLGARGISDKALVAFQKLTNGDVLSPDQWEAFHSLISESRTLSWQTAVREAERKHIPVNFLPDDLTAVQVPGHSASTIPTGRLQEFQKKYPNAAVLSERE